MNRIIFAIIACGLLASCSINKVALRLVSDVLTGEGGADTFTSDPDPQLIGDAIPFAIKMYEVLLYNNPDHLGLLNTTGSMFVMYANAFVQGPAEMLPRSQWRERELGLWRAKNLYLRGVDILYNGLETKYKGFREASSRPETLKPFLDRMTKNDVGTLYWLVAGGLSAYSIDVLDFELSGKIPQWSAMIHRAYELDPFFNTAALDEFFIIFYAALPEMLGGSVERAKDHFQRAMVKTKGKSVSAYVSYAQSIAIPAQDYDTFKEYLEKALEIDPNEDIQNRLVNIINQEKARWLLDNAWMYFSFLPIPDENW